MPERMLLLTKSSSSTAIVRATYITFFVLIAFWIGAWILRNFLVQRFSWIGTSQGSFVYWSIAKILIWILPALWLIKLSGHTLADVFNLSNWKEWLAWGGGLGFLIALTGIIPNYLQGNQILPTEFSFPLLNVLVIAPTFEEFLMRGAILGNLKKGHSFFVANLISSLMFVTLHVPGWYYMGVLFDNLTRPVGGAFSIFLVSLVFGYATHRSRSVMGGVLAHFLNNLS